MEDRLVSGRRDLGLKFEELAQVEVGDERVALATGLPKRDAETPNYPRTQSRWEGEPIALNDEERGGVEPPPVDEYRRSPIEEGLYCPSLERVVLVSGELDGRCKIEFAAKPGLDFVEAACHLGERGAPEHA
jgi:hypothetical protein